MRGTQINICTVESTNVADFEFPYNKPNNRLSISVRNGVQGSARQAIIGINSGQISADLPGGYERDDGYSSVKVGSGPVVTFRLTQPTSNSHQLDFIGNSAAFIKLVEKGGPVIVEANFYRHSRQQFTFMLSPLPAVQS